MGCWFSKKRSFNVEQAKLEASKTLLVPLMEDNTDVEEIPVISLSSSNINTYYLIRSMDK